jgi:hypothetical protein
MKIKALVSIQTDADTIYFAGDVLDIDKANAEALIANGHAEAVEAAKPETAAEKKAREKAEAEAAKAEPEL